MPRNSARSAADKDTLLNLRGLPGTFTNGPPAAPAAIPAESASERDTSTSLQPGGCADGCHGGLSVNGSAYIRTRTLPSGEQRHDVRYRRGGRGYRVEHGGTFRTLDDANARVRLIGRQIAAGASEIRLTAIPDAQAIEWIYFVRQGMEGPIKIGRAWNVDRRIKHMQTANPYQLQLLAKIPLEADAEEKLHLRFAAHQLIGEWFRPVPELLAYVREIAAEDHPA